MQTPKIVDPKKLELRRVKLAAILKKNIQRRKSSNKTVRDK